MEEGEWGLRAVFGRLRPRAEDLAAAKEEPPGKEKTDGVIESVLGDAGPLGPWTCPDHPTTTTTDYCCCYSTAASTAISQLARRLEDELRAAKRTRLGCGAVLLPRGLLRRVAADAWRMAESEPCGLRGCRLYVLLEAQPTAQAQKRCAAARVGAVRPDPGTECTFELYLTLRQAGGHWNFLPQFLRNLTRGGTVVISPAYTLSKKKLYRSYAAEFGESVSKTE